MLACWRLCRRLVCWCVEGCWRLCCVEGWCVGVLKARSPQWLQQGRWEGKARLRGSTGVKWGRRGAVTWLSICKDHPDCRVDGRWRLARRKAEDQALQVRTTLAWIGMVAGTGRRDIRCFSFMAVPCSLWDLSSPIRRWISAIAVNTRSPIHWTFRVFPLLVYFFIFGVAKEWKIIYCYIF